MASQGLRQTLFNTIGGLCHRRVTTCLFFALLFVPFLAGLGQEKMIDDEVVHVFVGLRYVELIARGKVLDPAWGTEEPGKFFATSARREPVGLYLIGVVPWLAGYREENLTREWIVNSDDILRATYQPGTAILWLARMPVAILGALSCVLVFYLGRELGSWKIGLFASLFLAYNPLWLACARRAQTETPSIFFSILSVLLLCHALKELNRRSTASKSMFLTLAFSGMALGLALGSKKFAGVTLIAIVLYFALRFSDELRHGFRAHTKVLLVGLFVILAICVSTYVGTYPYLYPDPYHRFLSEWEFWQDFNKAVQLTSIKDGIANPFYGLAVTTHRSLFPVITGTIDRPPPEGNMVVGFSPSDPLGPFGLDPMKEYYNWASYGSILWSSFFAFGLIKLLSSGIKASRNREAFSKRSIDILVLIWFLASFVGIASFQVLIWDREFLPVIPPMSIVAGFGFAAFCEWCSMRLKDTVYIQGLVSLIYASFIGSIVSLTLPPPMEYSYRGFQLIMARPAGIFFTAIYVLLILAILVLSFSTSIRSWTGRSISPRIRFPKRRYYALAIIVLTFPGYLFIANDELRIGGAYRWVNAPALRVGQAYREENVAAVYRWNGVWLEYLPQGDPNLIVVPTGTLRWLPGWRQDLAVYG